MSTLDDMLLAQSEELTTCSICTEKFSFSDARRLPKMLPCMHTFCNACLVRHHASVNEERITQTSNFPCPTCRKTCYLPVGGVDRLTTDHKVAQIIDLMNLVSGSVSKAQTQAHEVVCFVCSLQGEQSKAKKFCIQCKKLLCEKCSGLHLETSIFRDHQLYAMNFETRSSGKDGDKSLCRLHDSQWKYFCKTCKDNMCAVCVMMPLHTRHDIRAVSADDQQALGKEDENVDDSRLLASILDKKWRDIGASVEKLTIMKEAHSRSYAEVEIGIKKASEEAIRLIKENQTKLLKEAKFHKDNVSVELNDLEKMYSERQNSLKKLIQELNKSKDKKLQDLRLKANELNNSEIQIEPILFSYITFDAKTNVEIGKICFKSDADQPLNDRPLVRKTSWYSSQRPRRSSRTPPSSPFADDTSREEAFVSTGDGIRKEALIATLIKKWVSKRPALFKSREVVGSSSSSQFYEREVCSQSSYGRMVWQDRGFNDCRGCCFVDEGRVMLVVDFISAKHSRALMAFDANTGDKVNVDGVEWKTDEAKVSCICYNVSNKTVYLVVESSHLIKCLKIDKKKHDGLSVKITPSIKLAKEIASCSSIASMGDDLILAATRVESNSGGICLYSTRTQRFTNWIADIKRPAYLSAIAGRRHIVYSDKEGHEVKVVDREGGMQLRFNFSSSGHEMMPTGVDCDENGSMFVADEQTCGISLFNCDGELVDSLIETNAKPRAIRYNEQRKLIAVVCHNGVAVYAL